MKASLFFSLCLFCLFRSALPAQNPQETGCLNCPKYNGFMEQGKAFLKKNDFGKALTEFQAAQVAARICDCNSVTPSDYIRKVFDGIEQQRDAAIAAQKRAEKAEKNAKAEKDKAVIAQRKAIESDSMTRISKAQADSAKTQAIIAFQEAVKSDSLTKLSLIETDKARLEADSAFQKADKLIKAFYFYADKFAMAFKDDKFYFIDKNGNPVTKLGQWEKAEQFDWMGIAKVTQNGSSLLLDTAGNTYLVAHRIKDLGHSIEALDINEQFTRVPAKVFQYPHLKVLLINGRIFSDVYTEILGVPLGSSRVPLLKSLPSGIGSLKNLKVLSLYTNALTSLPTEIGGLKSLTLLNLGKNALTSLPTEIGGLKSLTWLNLGENALTSLPTEIGELRSLTQLYLRENQLTSLPEAIGALKNLKVLDLRENPINVEEGEKIRQLLPDCIIYGFTDVELSQKYSAEKNYSKAYYYRKKALENDSITYSNWYNLSFYALFVGKPQEAISAAQKTLELNPKAQRVETNLALGYLLNNQWPEAEKIYLKWKGKHFPNDKRLCDEVFLKDIKDLEEAGIRHDDFEKVKQLFRK